ncbi:MAG: gas vesicle protein K [Thermodesulfobacteriota bacterium]
MRTTCETSEIPDREYFMPFGRSPRVESNALSNFARVMEVGRNQRSIAKEDARRLNLDENKVKNGLGQLVLTIVKLLHELLERQAIRRMEGGTLSDSEIEEIGVTLMMQAAEIDRLRGEFQLADEDLNLDLGPLGKLL